MQYETATNKATIIKSIIIEDFQRNPEIRRTRCRLLALLFVLLIIFIIRFVKQIIFPDSNTSTSKDEMAEEILSTLIPTIHLIIFIIVVLKYIRIGILVFAWSTIIELITLPIIFIIEIIKLIRQFSSGLQTESLTFLITVFVIVAVIITIFAISIIILSFKLARLIKRSKNHPVLFET